MHKNENEGQVIELYWTFTSYRVLTYSSHGPDYITHIKGLTDLLKRADASHGRNESSVLISDVLGRAGLKSLGLGL